MSDSLPGREPVLRALIDICGPDFARPAGPADTVAGRLASFVAAPATTGAVAETMRLAAVRGLAVVPRGAATKIDWGTPPPGVDLLLDTGRLAGVWHQGSGALSAEVGAGTPVRAVQAALALRGRRLAVDPPSLGATIGGMLAVNESGPLRHRFGTPADQVNHVSYVDAGGVAAESDGENGRPGIAEIPGVMTSANLRLEALPAARRWVGVAVSTPLQVHNLVEETLAQQVEPSAIEVDLPTPTAPRTTEQPPGSLAVLIEGDRGSVGARAGRLAGAIGPGATVSEIAPRWWGRYPFGPADVAMRITVAIADLHAAVYALRDAAGGAVPVRGSAGIATVHAVLPGTLGPERVEGILDAVRSVLLARGGRAVLISAPPRIARAVDMAHSRDLF
jgi:glycolate oxidase FAD binding subunit